MNLWKLVWKSVVFHWRANLTTWFGATIGSAVLIGALLVGDSVRGSLREMALFRLGRTEFAFSAGDRFVTEQLAHNLEAELTSKAAPVLLLNGTASNNESDARANNVQVLGINEHFWKLDRQLSDVPIANGAILNERLSRQLRVESGDSILLRVRKPSLLSQDLALASDKDSSVAIRINVSAVFSDNSLSRFSLQANQIPPFNVFVPLNLLQKQVELPGKANVLLLAGAGRVEDEANRTTNAAAALQKNWSLADAELQLTRVTNRNEFELRSGRVFLDPVAEQAAISVGGSNAFRVLTYFVNDIRRGTNGTPYSMVCATDLPELTQGLTGNQMALNQWLAEDLGARVGDEVKLTYFVARENGQLSEKTNNFVVDRILPLSGLAADQTLMPDFPGLAKAESSDDWDTGFPIDLARIRDKDDEYWKNHRGTPKAFIALAAGQTMWSNRFGAVTGVRWTSTRDQATDEKLLSAKLPPSAFGLEIQPVRAQALAASKSSQNFHGLFVGFSFFLILAALLLIAMLFRLGMEQRSQETGTLLAIGFRPGQVKRLLLMEAATIGLLGALAGAALGVAYAKGVLYALTTVWREAIAGSSLSFHAAPATLIGGVLGSWLVCWITIWLAMRTLSKRSARELLAEGAGQEQMSAPGNRSKLLVVISIVCALGAAALIFTGLQAEGPKRAGLFFGSGALLLAAGVLMFRHRLNKSATRTELLQSMRQLGFRSASRRPGRSTATVTLFAAGAFLVIAVASNRLDANADSTKRPSGTGGFALFGETAVPVVHDLNEREGKEFYGLDEQQLDSVAVVPLRMLEGDDASCLNLNQVQKPRVLGVRPELLANRKAFTFSAEARAGQGWSLLQTSASPDEVPAIGDANSLQWALHKKVGDTLDYLDEQGRPFRLKIVGAVANSILQGSLIIDEKEFVKRYPSRAGYRMFLIDAPSNRVDAVSSALGRALQDAGLELTKTTDRLAAYNAVQNTYLDTFQILGGLGLLLGSLGLGVIVLRNVLERRGELAVLRAIGLRHGAVQKLVFIEHAGLLLAGLLMGVLAALIAIAPALVLNRSDLPLGVLAVTLLVICASGLLWVGLATRAALRGHLMDALRNN